LNKERSDKQTRLGLSDLREKGELAGRTAGRRGTGRRGGTSSRRRARSGRENERRRRAHEREADGRHGDAI